MSLISKILESLKEDHWTGQLFSVANWRAFFVRILTFRVGHESEDHHVITVSLLRESTYEFVRIGSIKCHMVIVGLDHHLAVRGPA